MSGDAGYTKGPLETRPEPGAAQAGLYMVVDLSQPDATVCTASYCTKADAVLYASAPALLEALEGLREACFVRDTAIGQSAKLEAADKYTEALFDARAAIAAATGKQP